MREKLVGKPAKIQKNVSIGELSEDLEGKVEIGDDSIIRSGTSDNVVGTATVIDGNKKIGNNVYIPKETVIEDDFFLRASCTLTNDKYMINPQVTSERSILKGPIKEKELE